LWPTLLFGEFHLKTLTNNPQAACPFAVFRGAGRGHAQEPVNFACTARRTITLEVATAKSAGDEHVTGRRGLFPGCDHREHVVVDVFGG
jgi:hypothetical protein